MLFAVLFEDAPDADPDIRKRYMPDHLSFLETSPEILSAGPLTDTSGEADGGLWLVDTEDQTAVEALIEADPFWPTGLRKSVRVRRWKQVYSDGKRQI